MLTTFVENTDSNPMGVEEMNLDKWRKGPPFTVRIRPTKMTMRNPLL